MEVFLSCSGEVGRGVRLVRGVKGEGFSPSVGMLGIGTTDLMGDEGAVPPSGRGPARVERS